jgi:adenine-specific DNA-methyltransferase
MQANRNTTLTMHIEKLLMQESTLVVAGQLLKNRVVEAVLKMDGGLLSILHGDQVARSVFFHDVNGISVFDKVEFHRFISNKNFLPDSYTAFKNKIGLAGEDNLFLSDRNDVVLAWPYKDCVLEGGQDREDAARKEVFWNVSLAREQIDHLLSPKTLVNFRRLTSNGEVPLGQVSLHDNMIIKGNNLLTLHSLKKGFEGKVKLIYIDPPYNTEKDSFAYNDNFSHSTWLTFMKNRLEAAKELLRDDGVIFISLDDKEAHYCKVLADTVFGRDNFIADICHKSRSSVSNDKIISASHNHLLLYAKKEREVFKNKERFGIKNDLSGFTQNDGVDDYKLVPVDGPGGAAKGNPWYEFLGVQGYWRFSKSRMEEMYSQGLIVKTSNSLMQKLYKSKAAEKKKTVTTWWDEGFLNSTATSDLKKLMGSDVFKNPKSVQLLKRIIELWTEEGDIVLDFFAGSGTTGHACLELSHEDGIRRQFILCEQMNYENGLPSSRVAKALGQEDSFIEFELARLNETFVARILGAETKEELAIVWKDMQAQGFLSYVIDVSAVDRNADTFDDLVLDHQKQFLIETLDKNMLYLPLSEIADDSYRIDDLTRDLNRAFYEGLPAQ